MAKEITYAGWTGTNNKNELWELKLPTKDDPRSDLSATQNIDLDDRGLPSTRDGYALFGPMVGAHSGYSSSGVFVYVRKGVMYRFYPASKTSVPLVGVGNDNKMRYCDGAGRIFFTNGVVIGEISDGSARLFAAPDNDLKEMTPPGQAIAFFRGRLWTFFEELLCMSDDTHLARTDSEAGFQPFTEPGRVIAPMSSEQSCGIYVGTEKALYYGEGAVITKMAFIKVLDAPVKDVPIQYVDAFRVYGLKTEGRFPLIHTDAGVCLGLPLGQTINLTEEKFEMPSGTTGASMIRKKGQQHFYISVYR